MAFLDWIAPLSPVRRDEPHSRVYSADICPLTWSFWVVEGDDASPDPAPLRPDPRRRTEGEA